MCCAPPSDGKAPGALHRIARRLRGGGWRWLAGALLDRAIPARPRMQKQVMTALRDGHGLEVGGPSRVFTSRGMLPAYSWAARVDNVNFAARTAWEGGLRDGGDFHFAAGKAPGTQWLREATTLTGIATGAYDFVLSSHCLEHVANPLAALQEWRRITRGGGHLLLVLPNAAKTFDRRRPVTTLDHLRDDFQRCTGEDDLTHLPEALKLHDLALDAGAGTFPEFQARAERNAENRCLHHHVFDLTLVQAMLAESGWQVLASEEVRPLHLAALARKDLA